MVLTITRAFNIWYISVHFERDLRHRHRTLHYNKNFRCPECERAPQCRTGINTNEELESPNDDAFFFL